MDINLTAAPKYPCDHLKVEGHEYCPKCCFLCGHPNTGEVAFIANPTLLGAQGPGIQIGQCLAIDTQTLQRCNMIIRLDAIQPAPSVIQRPPGPKIVLN